MKSQPPLTLDQLIPWGREELEGVLLSQPAINSGSKNSQASGGNKRRKLNSDWDGGPPDPDPDEDVKMEMHFDALMLSLPPESDWNCE